MRYVIVMLFASAILTGAGWAAVEHYLDTQSEGCARHLFKCR